VNAAVPIEGLLAPISRAVKALDAAARTGIDFEDAFKALRSLDGLSPLAKEGIGARVLRQLYETCTKRGKAAFAFSAGGAREDYPVRQYGLGRCFLQVPDSQRTQVQVRTERRGCMDSRMS
jgi:hypothetical protein